MAFMFKLEYEDGMLADPPTLCTAVPNWEPGDTISLGRDRALRVIETRIIEEQTVLVVETHLVWVGARAATARGHARPSSRRAPRRDRSTNSRGTIRLRS